MFTPNLVGKLYRRETFSRFGQAKHAAPISCEFAFVNAAVGAEKTSVRADSSASRGAADEMTAERFKILVVKYMRPTVGDKFSFEDQSFLIQSIHPRRDVFGRLDHYECDLELVVGE